ncbi:MAG TPA: PrgI family protein [Patescibacteria group bacterium]|nr:PrgI family protein [Patescibacteria group bacterium]
MDNHPIPQDVTHFQFQLIGNMTVKQFAYLGSGIILAWIMFAFPIFFLLKIIFAILFAGGGSFLAFAPLEGRPADVMVGNFMKALFAPTVYIYQKKQVKPQTVTTANVSPVEKQKTEKKKQEMVTMQPTTIIHPPAIVSQPVQTLPQAQLAPKNTGGITAEKTLINEAVAIQKAITNSKAQEIQGNGEAAQLAHQKTVELEEQLRSMLEQKNALENQLIALQKQVAQKPQQTITPTATLQPTSPRVIKVPKSMATSVGVPLTSDVPNLITGVVKDPRGNVLPRILIEVVDKDGNPVRAFKTNSLGQFASATPLNNGAYTVTLEDPEEKNKFDAIELIASGTIMLPLEIISVDQREVLRKELFGT